MSDPLTDQWAQELYKAIKSKPLLHSCAEGQRVGVLAKESVYSFTYNAPEKNEPPEVSIGLPYRVRSYTSGDLFGIFAMNEPEGYLRLYIEDAMSRVGIPNKLLFLALSQGLQVGRVSYQHPIIELDAPTPESLEQILGERDASYFDRLLARYALRSNLSGAQPKIIVPTIDGSRWDKASIPTRSLIVKEAGAEFPGLSLNEYFCMSVAKKAGLDLPNFWLSDDATRFVIERFDRDEQGHPIGFEDMTVLAGLTAAQKYQGSYEAIMRIVKAYCSDKKDALEHAFARVAISALLKDGDAHLKNFGLTYRDMRSPISLAPVYDVVCTAIYPNLDRGLALKLNKSRTFPIPNDLMRFATKLDINLDFASNTITNIDQAITEQINESMHDDRFHNDPYKTLDKLIDVMCPAGFSPKDRIFASEFRHVR